MAFANDKKTFLAKLDKSKKGEIDEKVVELLQLINQQPDYYTTSSCSGRVYLWSGTGKKNETKWLRVSHDLIKREFLNLQSPGLVWLRLEPLILHLACRDLNAANKLLETVRKLYKKSCLLSASNKLVIEVRGSEFLELPLYQDGELLFKDLDLLTKLVNEKLERIFKGIKKLELEIKK